MIPVFVNSGEFDGEGWWVLPLRVRFCEVDVYGYVWHGHYLDWLEEARNDLARQFGFTPSRMQEMGYLLPLQELSLTFKSPAGLDQEVVVAVRHRPTERAVIEFEYAVRRASGGQELARGWTRQVVTTREGELLLRYPPPIREALDALDRDQSAASACAAGAPGEQAPGEAGEERGE